MQGKWQRRRILIWGKTRPELSKTYNEIVCTGGIFEDTKRLVRIYPVPLRYMDDESIFAKYQWIEADVTRSDSDSRPESYKIRAEGIQVLGKIPTKNGNWDERAKWVLQDENIFSSVEALRDQQQKDGTSLGIVKPMSINDITFEPTSQKYRDGFWGQYQGILAQRELPLDIEGKRDVKPLKPPDYRFKIRFQCDDEQCQMVHNFSVFDWEVDALYFRLRQKGDDQITAANKVVDKLAEITCKETKDCHFFLGNIFTHPRNFIIAGFWSPKKQKAAPMKQLGLFAEG